MMAQGNEPVVRTAVEDQLQEIKQSLLQLGDLVIKAIDRSLCALQNMDHTLAQAVVDEDHVLNDIRFQVEEYCLKLIATQQPAAGDLRAIVAAMTIVGDLERMGDHAAGIAKTVLRMSKRIDVQEDSSLLHMAQRVQKMLKDGMCAYDTLDAGLAYDVANMDDAIDSEYQALFKEYLEMMASNPEMTAAALYLLFAGHNLERIGDRVTNITERVIFMTSGELEELNV